jgi:hypothetical protein
MLYMDEHAIAYDVTVGALKTDEIKPGEIYLSCMIELIDFSDEDLKDVFTVFLAHNLTGIKGVNFDKSRANLNIIGGKQVAEVQKIDLNDPRYVIGGYAKWDKIYKERFLQEQRRRELAESKGLNPTLPWICYYPTGPNRGYQGGHVHTFDLFDRMESEFDACEFIFCNHAENERYPESKWTLEKLEFVEREEDHLHVIDGSEALAVIAACDLFITDVASTLITALSMEKPVAFVPIIKKEPLSHSVQSLQCGKFTEDIADLAAYIKEYDPPPELEMLFNKCVAHDDDQNCRRIVDLIRERHARWCAQRKR